MTSKQSRRRAERRKAHEEKARQGSKAAKITLGAGVGVGAVLAMAAPAAAQDFTVTNLDNSGPGSLRNAIDDSNADPDADRILFQSGLTGTINLVSGLFSYEDLEIAGPGADKITVAGTDTIAHPLFSAADSYTTTNRNFTLSGLTLKDGYSYYGLGGAIAARGTNLTVNDAVFLNNRGGIGGAIYTGGYVEGRPPGSLDVDHSTFSGNTASSGGAIATFGEVHIDNSTFNNNRGLVAGGAIVIATAESGGELAVTQSTFNHNTSLSAGGAIAMVPGESEEIPMDLSVESSTISGNQAGFVGGGIAGGFTGADVKNSVIEGNFAYYGPDLYSDTGGCSCYPETDFMTSFSFIGDTNEATITTSVAGSNILNGGDALLGRLADNGGSTKTMAIGPESPVVNKGSSPLTVDQRDEKRPVLYPGIPNSAAPGANGADMGAFELQYEEPPPPPPPYRPFLIVGSTPHRGNGTATVRVKIPAPGSVRLVGNKLLKSSERHFASKGVYKFKAVPIGKNIKRRLNKKGRARVLVKFRYTPDEGRVLAKGKLIALFKGNKSKKAKRAALREWRSLGSSGS